MYGYCAVSHSAVSQWPCRLSGESGHANIWDSPCTSRPHTSQTPDNVQCLNDMDLVDSCVTVKQMSIQLINRKKVWAEYWNSWGWQKFVHGGFQGWWLSCENHDGRWNMAAMFAEQDLKMMMPSLRPLNSGSIVLVQSFTVLAFRC